LGDILTEKPGLMKWRFASIVCICCACIFAFHAPGASAQHDPESRSWNQPFPPFRIIGNIYYVGANEITSFLITTPKGHILLDGGFAETAPQIEANIRKLGFKLEDVKVLLNTHAHIDHAGGLAELKRATKAIVMASAADAPMLAAGGHGDFFFGDRLAFPPVVVDGIVRDGGVVSLGGMNLTAHVTPGHTRGCTTWTMNVQDADKLYSVVFICSVTVLLGSHLVNNAAYPQIAEDFARTFHTLTSLPCDVFLGSHGSFFDLEEKRKAQRLGAETNPFIDPGGYREAVKRWQERFETELARQLAQASPNQ